MSKDELRCDRLAHGGVRRLFVANVRQAKFRRMHDGHFGHIDGDDDLLAEK